MPVPLPTTSSTARPVNQAMRAAEAVVLPIPMSPVIRQRDTGGDELPGHLGPHIEGGESLGGGHGRFELEVGRSITNLAAQEVGGGIEAPRHSDVDHDHLGPHLAGDGTDGGTAAAEIGHHLAGDFRGPGRDTGGDDAVIAGENGDGGGFGNGRRAGAGHAGQADAKLLERSKRTSGLGQATVVLSGRLHGARVGGDHGSPGVVEGVGHSVLPGLVVDGPLKRAGLGPTPQGELGRGIETPRRSPCTGRRWERRGAVGRECPRGWTDGRS